MGCGSSQTLDEGQPYFATQGPISSQEMERIADRFFKEGQFAKAIQAYKYIIEQGYSIDFQIAGLGNAEHAAGRYEWFLYRWYDEQRTAGRIRGNAFDALSLCFSAIRKKNDEIAERGILWYERMIGLNETIQLLVGYANILYNQQRQDEAIKVYNKVIEKRPSLVNAYVSIILANQFGVLYKYMHSKPDPLMAKKILEMDPDNIYAHFILAKSEMRVQSRISKLKLVAEKFPQYLRVAREIGRCYYSDQMYREAIPWYMKCILTISQYYSCFGDIGLCYKRLNDENMAVDWCFKGLKGDPEDKFLYDSLVRIVYDRTKQVLERLEKQPILKSFKFYFYWGRAYSDYGQKGINGLAIHIYKLAQELQSDNLQLVNGMGEAWYQQEKYYLKAIDINPKYAKAYQNLGNYKLKGYYKDPEAAIQYFKKGLDIDPKSSGIYKGLGSAYQQNKNYSKAVECYQKAVEHQPTDTTVFLKMGICLLQIERYQEAYFALKHAKGLYLMGDSRFEYKEDKEYIQRILKRFNQEGEQWSKTGTITAQQKEILKSLNESFEANCIKLYSGKASTSISDEKALKSEVLQIISLVYEDKFELKNIDKVFELVKRLFHESEDYFHIIPQLFIQHFWKSGCIEKWPVLEIEAKLKGIIKAISTRESPDIREGQGYSLDIKMQHFSPPKEFKVNLFKDNIYFNSYQELYSEIEKVNNQAEESLPEFKEFVETVRSSSNGIPYGVSMKLPKDIAQQFKVILRILEKMFKKEINQKRVESIITKIDMALLKRGDKATLINVVHEILQVWTTEITGILMERRQYAVPTPCAISDLLRGKIMFNTVEDLAKAVEACDKLCHLRGYEILELDNRLSKPQTMDVVLKVKVKEAVCEFQLAMRQDESKYHLIHSIYEIERSPLGCIFGSYLFMSKGFSYPLLTNCKDIEARLSKRESAEDQKTVEAARFMIKALEGSK